MARKLAEWSKMIAKKWINIKISSVEDNLLNDIDLMNTFKVRARVRLADLTPQDVSVQVYWGFLDSRHNIINPKTATMNLVETGSDGFLTFEAEVTADRVGHCGYAVRIMPQYNGTVQLIPGLILWQ
jgi:starch phosphorylase